MITRPLSRYIDSFETSQPRASRSPRVTKVAAWVCAPLIAAALFLSLGSAFAVNPVYTATPDHPTGVYAPNEKVTWTIDVTGDRSTLTAVPYKVKKDDADVVTSGTLDLSTGPATVSGSRPEPGALQLSIFSMDKTNLLPLGMGGAVIAPEKMTPARPAPEDFDAFWKSKLAELSAVPVNPVVEKISTEGIKNSEGMELYKVTLDNIKGSHVHAILAKPAKEGKFPAMLMFNSAGVGPLDKAAVIGQAKAGWLVLNVGPHDIPVDEPDAYYKELKEQALKNYIYIGKDSRDECYFLRMFLGCVRGAEYLASRPDWNGSVLVATGASQGGLQTFAAASLYPKITCAMTMVPAGCDVYGPLATPPRCGSWPYWLVNWAQQGKDPEKIKQTAGYFDSIYFASRLHCPSLVAVALLDTAACPAGVIAAYNGITAPKKLITMPMSNHYGAGSGGVYFTEFLKWKDALQKGQPLPVTTKE